MHHYVPKFYLTGFTEQEDENGELHVIDFRRRAAWKATPTNTAKERGFYSLDNPDMGDAMAIERLLGDIETRIAPVMQSIQRGFRPKSLSDCEELMTLVAMMIVRVPRARDAANDVTIAKMRETMVEYVSTPDRLAKFCELAGVVEAEDQKRMRDFVQSDDYELAVGNSWWVGRMLEAVPFLIRELSARAWQIARSDRRYVEFVCSNSPVAILPKEHDQLQLRRGLWRPTTVVMPINRRSVLYSDLRGPLRRGSLTAFDVARINTNTMAHATQAYSATPNFRWIERGMLRNGSYLRDLISSPVSG